MRLGDRVVTDSLTAEQPRTARAPRSEVACHSLLGDRDEALK
jgi:hypothetical protein